MSFILTTVGVLAVPVVVIAGLVLSIWFGGSNSARPGRDNVR